MCEKIHKDLVYNYNEYIKLKNVGIIITASHNPHDENGIKIIGVDGKYINKTYENYLIELVNNHLRYIKKNVNCTCDDIINNTIELIVDIFKKEINLDISDDIIYENICILDDIIYNYNIHNKIKTNICIGFDTRNSNIHLNNIIIESLNCLNIYKCINNITYITTPCMHFLIYFLNYINENDEKIDKQIIQQEEYTIHKKSNDLSYLKNFHIQNNKSVYYLYYSKYDQYLTNEVLTTNGTPLQQPFNISIQQHIEKEKEKKNSHENNNFIYTHMEHIYAYNSDQIYFDYFIYSFEMLYNYITKLFHNNHMMMDMENIYLDCSNGIASLKIDKFYPIFQILKKNICKFNCIEGEHSILNYECGAEYVYRKQQPPKNVPPIIKHNTKFCTFDGDADRILYFFFPQKGEEIKKKIFNDGNEKNKNNHTDININCNMIYNMIYNNNNNINCKDNNFHSTISDFSKEQMDYYDANIDTCKNNQIAILDGPKIICLFFLCIIKMLSHIKLEELKEEIPIIDLNIIHTAYTNSAFLNYINYIKNNIIVSINIFKYININILCTKTGMKYLDHLAQKACIGIFFEPNGHGTIYVDINKLQKWSLSLHINYDLSFIALQKYLLFFNQTVGDAFLDFIAIELSLSILNITINEWNNFYTPFPSMYININCPKHILPKIIPHPKHEQYLIEPITLQTHINQIVNSVDQQHGRCFVRPSGTENLLRIYAEAQTEQKMKDILDKARTCVLHYIEHIL